MRHRFSPFGFTLSELLIAMGILGVIAALTLPGAFKSVTAQQNKAKFKQAVTALNKALDAGLDSDEITVNPGVSTNSGTYLLNHITSTKVCTGNSQSEGCAPPSQTGYSWEVDEPGVVLNNGTMLYGLNNDPSGGGNGVCIDVNGTAAPNTIGKDIVAVFICDDYRSCTGSTIVEGSTAAYGKVTYTYDGFSSTTYRDANKALFISLFK